jgi:hypothetical protein
VDEHQPITLSILVPNDLARTDQETCRLIADINQIDQAAFMASDSSAKSDDQSKGDPITLGAIVLAAVGGGGAFAKGFGPNGFFSKLAEIIRERTSKGVVISITQVDGTQVKLSGSPKDIINVLKISTRRR